MNQQTETTIKYSIHCWRSRRWDKTDNLSIPRTYK